MSTTLAQAMCEGSLAKGFAEVRRFIDNQAVTVNGELATSWNQQVNSGDIIKLGKRRVCVVR